MKHLMTLSVAVVMGTGMSASALRVTVDKSAAALRGTVDTSAEAPGRELTPLKIVAFGDSLTSGHRLGPKFAYPAVLESRLNDAGLPAKVINQGISGETTARGVQRLKAALDQNPQILLVAFGANDGLRGVPVAQVRKNLEQIIEGAQARNIKVVLCGMEALPLYGWQYTVDFHQLFPALAAKYDVPLVPFLLDGVIGDPDLMSPDGLHPNAAGARVLADNIWPYLLPVAQSLATAGVGG
jgi:acyl-CoA thioesterase I